jgi:hypothetical protein
MGQQLPTHFPTITTATHFFPVFRGRNVWLYMLPVQIRLLLAALEVTEHKKDIRGKTGGGKGQNKGQTDFG